MAEYLVNDSELTGIADKLRSATDTADLIAFPDGFEDKIIELEEKNPNHKLTFSGTVADPTGGNAVFDMADIRSLIYQRKATADLFFEFQSFSIAQHLNCWEPNMVMFANPFDPGETTLETVGGVYISWGTDGIFRSAIGLTGGQILDFSQYATSIPARLELYYYEMPTPTTLTLNVTSNLTQTLYYTLSQGGVIAIDWGDNSTTEIRSGIGTSISHTYPSAAEYTVEIQSLDGTWALGASGYRVIGEPAALTHFAFGDGARLQNSITFDSCINLTNITITKNAVVNHTIPEYCFRGCSALSSVSIPSNVRTVGREVFKNCDLTNIDLSETEITEFSDEMLYGNTHLSEIKWPANLKTIGINALRNTAFTELTIPDTVTIVNQYLPTSLKSIEFGTGIEDMTTLFAVDNNTNLEYIICRATTPPALHESAFRLYSALMSIYVPFASVDTYKADANWGKHANKIKSIESILGFDIPSTAAIRTLYYYQSQVGDAIKRVTVDFGNGQTSSSDSQNASVTLPYSAAGQYTATIIENDKGATWSPGCVINNTKYGIFGSGTKSDTYPFLTSVKLGITGKLNSEYGFAGCTSLTEIEIPEHIFGVNDYQFKGCVNITQITCLAKTPPTIYSNTLTDLPADCVIYVPAASVAAYQAASGWSDRAAYIQAIPS